MDVPAWAWVVTEPAAPSPPSCWPHGVWSCKSFQDEGCPLCTPLQIPGKHLLAHLFLRDSFPPRNRKWVIHRQLQEVLRVDRLTPFNSKNTFDSNLIIIHCQNGNYPSATVFLLLWVYPATWEGGMGQEAQLESAQVRIQRPAKTKAKSKQKCPQTKDCFDKGH